MKTNFIILLIAGALCVGFLLELIGTPLTERTAVVLFGVALMKLKCSRFGFVAAFCLLGIFVAPAQPQDGQSKEELHVLFIGNSLTYYQDLPKMTAELAKAGDAAKQGDGPKVLGHLARAGEWALQIAVAIGVPVAVKALEAALGS